ncbi:hypothetical protein [Actinacidiphila rubida]|uniref:Uncharacterized protein n=1 Tax=Actinacidiphila rubida TaxID=310780 RepID=A0A1H8GFY1_9ACTN|nr:hypothetical protein [Actinacidiphila rubida]SEN42654.1 hypothetical protein SAMN05216267_100565 [Actinacidiphila rubida]
MVTLRHAVTLEPVPRDWFEDALRAVVDAVEELREERKRLFAGGERVPAVRLAAGHHIGRGARYLIEDVDDAGVVAFTHRVDVRAWDRSAIRLRYEGTSAELRVRGEAELRGVDSPAALKWSGDVRGSGSRYRRGRVKAALDLRAWWGQTPGGPAPLTADLRHPLVRAAVRVTMTRAKDGRWRTVVAVTSRGRGWARPPAAVAAVLGGFFLRRAYRRGLDDFAREWNAEVPRMTSRTPGELKAEFLHGLAAGPADAGTAD